MHESPDQKSTLRQQLRQQRRDLSAQARKHAKAGLGTQLATIPDLASARRIATYLPADGEIDPGEAVQRMRKDGVEIYLPVILDDNSLLFAPWHERDTLAPNRFGIPEPPADAPRYPAGKLDALLLPLVGWDRYGGRLGMGGGFYDRSLQHSEGVLKIGLAFELQQVDALPTEPWDVALDYVITESALYDCQAERQI